MENFTWDDMDFWSTGEWQATEERLRDFRRARKVICPKKEDMFAALDATPLAKVKVAIFGQDPYPDPDYATGIAFSIPEQLTNFPPTLLNIFKEYHSDLGLPFPETGCLKKWCDEGVLLWNVIPSCLAFQSLSHQDWPEWKMLTKEIVERLSSASVMMVFLGGRARDFLQYVDILKSDVLCASHPSPRGSYSGHNPFIGSHLFTTINDKLQAEGVEPIDWRL